jgi:hypothetical protein
MADLASKPAGARCSEQLFFAIYFSRAFFRFVFYIAGKYRMQTKGADADQYKAK